MFSSSSSPHFTSFKLSLYRIDTRVISRFASVACALWAIGCNDTAIVLRFASDRPATGAAAIDGMCVELDAGGGQKFGRRYSLPSLPLPQTLTVLPGGKPGAQMIVYGLQRGTEVTRT